MSQEIITCHVCKGKGSSQEAGKCGYCKGSGRMLRTTTVTITPYEPFVPESERK